MILSPGQIGLHVRLRASQVDRLVAMDGLVLIRMMFPRLDHVKLVMVFTPIGLHGTLAHRLAQVVINSVFDLILVVNLMSAVLDVNFPRLKPVDLRVNGHSGPITLLALRHVQTVQ